MNSIKSLLSLLFLSSIYLISFCQTPCGYDMAVDLMESKYPGFKAAAERTIKQAKNRGSRNSSMVYTIPVVVHIVHNQAEENIDDELIASQLEVLNEDFRRLNSNASDVRAIFEEVVGDPMIEFELAETVRVKTNTEFSVNLITGELPDNVKNGSSGGSDAWDTERYLNIWICKIQPITFGTMTIGQLLGYAYPPAGLDNWPVGLSAPSPALEGVVLEYRTIGRNSPFTIDPGLGYEIQMHGRSATHEVGHYLGLRHIWGDGGDIFGGSDSCNEDDFVDDTPNTGSQAIFDCDFGRNTCSDPNNDLPDMIENYMDYSSEDCVNSFTKGQIAIMRSVLENERCALVEACDPASIEWIDEQAINVFPNPIIGEFKLEYNTVDISGFQFSIHSTSGKVVKNFSEKGQSNFDINDLSSGVYYLHGVNGNKMINKKIVKY